MSTNRTERLLNLVIALSATTRWLTKEQLRRAVPQYEDCESVEAFDRMFERDKEDLRELGVPLVTGTNDAWFDDEQGYRIDREAYALPPIELTAPELAVLGLASRVWQQAGLAGPAARAMLKLKALGVRIDEEWLAGLEPRVRATGPAFEPLYTATRDGAPVAFAYRKPREPGAAPAMRRVEPWALTNRGGWWYLVGLDLDRKASRAFRLSRITGPVRRIGPTGTVTVPQGLDPGALVTAGRGESDPRTARLRLAHGRGTALRLRTDARPDGADHLHLPVRDVVQLAEQLAGYGPDVVVESPEDLRDAVLDHLQAVLEAHPAADTRPAAAGAAEPAPAPLVSPR